MASNRRRDTGGAPDRSPVHFWPGPGKYWRWPGAVLLCRTEGTALAATGDRAAVTCRKCKRRLSWVPTRRPVPWSRTALLMGGFLTMDAPSAPLAAPAVELRPRLPVPAQPSPLLSMAARWRGHAAELYAKRTAATALAALVLTSAAAELEDLVEQIRKGAA